MTEKQGINHYFVDEAGDLVLFDKRGKVIVGSPGCSSFFMVGVAQIEDPEGVVRVLNSLTTDILADPYFRGVPSMQKDAGKTALGFHAKDDLPEVRREVFRLLLSCQVKVQVVVRRKASLVALARMLHSSGQRLTDNHVYDDMVKQLFRNLLHKADGNRIVFARRGKSERFEALSQAITRAQVNFEAKFGTPSDKPTRVHSLFSRNVAGLQVIDYFLWALQRLFERQEERYFDAMRSKFRLIIDLDDTRKHRYGEYYSDSNPLSVEKIKAF